jgi:hypothetical protein
MAAWPNHTHTKPTKEHTMKAQSTESNSESQARAQFESIEQMVKLLSSARIGAENATSDDRLCQATLEQAEQAIQQDPLSIEVRSGWATLEHWARTVNTLLTDREPHEKLMPEEFNILLCTGGPAVRIIGTLSEHGEPESARLEHQDWGTPWTEYRLSGEQQDILLAYCRCFYFGE